MKIAKHLVIAGTAAASLACNPSASPTSPAVLIPGGTHQSPLVAVSGQGAGGVSVTSTPIPEGTMRVDITVVVADAHDVFCSALP